MSTFPNLRRRRRRQDPDHAASDPGSHLPGRRSSRARYQGRHDGRPARSARPVARRPARPTIPRVGRGGGLPGQAGRARAGRPLHSAQPRPDVVPGRSGDIRHLHHPSSGDQRYGLDLVRPGAGGDGRHRDADRTGARPQPQRAAPPRPAGQQDDSQRAYDLPDPHADRLGPGGRLGGPSGQALLDPTVAASPHPRAGH